MNLPSSKDIESLHRTYAPTEAVFELVYTHCLIVRDIAQQLIELGNLDLHQELVEAGCLLHDIGVYPLFDGGGNERRELHYITHGIRGEEILKAEGLPEALWRVASHHTGVGLTKQDIEQQKLPLPHADYNAESKEERLVMYADKFHSKTSPPYFNPYDWYRDYVGKFGPDKVQRFEEMAQEFGVPDLAPLTEKYGHAQRG